MFRHRLTQALLVSFLVGSTAQAADLLVCDCANDKIIRYLDTMPSTTESITDGGLDCPFEMVFGPDGNLYSTSFFSDSVLRFDGTTGAFIDEFVSPGSGGLDAPYGLAFGPDGNLYVVSQRNDRVLKYDGENGSFLSIFASVGLLNPTTCGFGKDGNLYVADAFTDQILRFGGLTGDPIDIFVNAGSDLHAFSFGPDCNIYVTAGSNDNIRRYDGGTGTFLDEFIPSRSGGLLEPRGLAFGPNGNLYVSDAGNGRILRYDGTTGTFLGIFVEGINPFGMVFAPPGRVSRPTILTDLLETELSIQTFDPLEVEGRLLNGPSDAGIQVFAWIQLPNGTILDVRPQSFLDPRVLPANFDFSIQRVFGIAGQGVLSMPGPYSLGTRIVDDTTGVILSQTRSPFEILP